MDRERLISYFEKNYLPRKDALKRIPLGVQLDSLWQEVLSRRRNNATELPIHGPDGAPFWYVLTPAMIAASEKIVEEMMTPQQATELMPMEESFYTSYVEGSPMAVKDAIDFINRNEPPQDIHEQLIMNNWQAITLAMENAGRPITEELICMLAGVLTTEMNGGGENYRTEDQHAIPSMGAEKYVVPTSASIPGLVRELCVYLADSNVHPLLKAAVAHAWFMVVRPFGEGNERLARLIASMSLAQAGYTFFSEISLSALIAQDGYNYYEAVNNLLREGNGGDWTYLIEYYIVLLGKGVDEIHQRRRNQQEELARQSLGQAQAGKAVAASAPSEVVRSEPAQREAVQASETEENADPDPFHDHPEGDESSKSAEEALVMEGFETVKVARGKPLDRNEAENTGPYTAEQLRRRLSQTNDRQREAYIKARGRLLEFLDQGRLVFRKDELTDGIAESPKQADNIITNMRQVGFIVSNGVQPPDNKMTYALNIMIDYSPDIMQEIQKLATSKYSTKDRRIGNLLISKLALGYVDLLDYVALGEEIKWEPEMRFAEQLGVVTRESRTRFTINHELRRGYDKLDYWQKNMASELYDEFGDGSFTSSMIFAKLEYNKDRAIATLHTFSMMGILGTDLDAIDGKTITYQFRVTPAEHPECFEKAA